MRKEKPSPRRTEAPAPPAPREATAQGEFRRHCRGEGLRARAEEAAGPAAPQNSESLSRGRRRTHTPSAPRLPSGQRALQRGSVTGRPALGPAARPVATTALRSSPEDVPGAGKPTPPNWIQF